MPELTIDSTRLLSGESRMPVIAKTTFLVLSAALVSWGIAR
jgi:hypothetical protein